MKEEYIIINKTAILKRIEEWVNKFGNEDSESVSEAIHLFQSLSSQSTPLIPEIEKAFYGGQRSLKEKVLPKKTSQDYISNLKLDI